MDRSWINASQIGDLYENGGGRNGRYYYPCVNFLNGKQLEIQLIREYVYCDGFLKSHKCGLGMVKSYTWFEVIYMVD